MVILRAVYYWAILIALTVFFVYFTLVNDSINRDFQKGGGGGGETVGVVKKIVAYSLLKQIEIESEEYSCEAGVNFSEVVSEGWGGDLDWVNVGGSDFYVSTVNLDRRLEPYHYIRVVGMVKGNRNQTLYCQIRTSQDTYHITKSTLTPIWSHAWDKGDTSVYFNPILVSCRVPSGVVPTSVGLSTTVCGRSEGNIFRVSERKTEEKNSFTVCVKPLDFSKDISRRLIQWIEINRVLGAEKFDIYVGNVTENVSRILKWYSSTYPSQVYVRRFQKVEENLNSTDNFEQFIWQKRRYEVIAYNNCFYRHIEMSRFVVPLDIDEIIVPKKFLQWKQFVTDLFSSRKDLEEKFASFTVPNTYFFDKLNSNNIFFFRNLNRSGFSPAGVSGKSFVSTQNALTVFNHYALDILRPGVGRAYFVPPSMAQLNHYKENCVSVILPGCLKYFSSPRIKDTVILKYTKLFFDKYNRSVVKMQSSGIL